MHHLAGAQRPRRPSVDFRALAARGITLVEPTTSFSHGTMRFAPDISVNIAHGDANYLALLDEADAYIARNGLDLPEEPAARVLGTDPAGVTDPLLGLRPRDGRGHLDRLGDRLHRRLQLVAAMASTSTGEPKHRRGVSSEPGVYYLGLPWLSRRGSAHLGGLARHSTGRPHHDPAWLPRLRTSEPSWTLTGRRGVAEYTLRQLEILRAVAESGSITGAAAQLPTCPSRRCRRARRAQRALDVQLLLRHHARQGSPGAGSSC